MASDYEIIALVTFASKVPAKFVRRGMKKYLLSMVDPDGKLKESRDEFITALEELKRKADAVVVLDEQQSRDLGLPAQKHIIFVEAEHSAPIPVGNLYEYADLYDLALGSESPYYVAVIVLNRYGSHQILDLGGIFVSQFSTQGDDFKNSSAFNAHSIRTFSGT